MKLIPNFLSLLRIMLVFPIIYLLQVEWYVFAASLFFVSSLTDYFDGYLARKYAIESELGAFLDLVADKILVIAILVWLVFLFTNQALTIISILISILIILREIIITSFRYYIVSNNADPELIKANKYGKLKTAFQFFSILLLILSPAISNFYLSISLVLLSVSVLLSYFSLAIYFTNWMKQ